MDNIPSRGYLSLSFLGFVILLTCTFIIYWPCATPMPLLTLYLYRVQCLPVPYPYDCLSSYDLDSVFISSTYLLMDRLLAWPLPSYTLTSFRAFVFSVSCFYLYLFFLTMYLYAPLPSYSLSPSPFQTVPFDTPLGFTVHHVVAWCYDYLFEWVFHVEYV